ncbi:MAG: gluconeogenesis factor YvcK family protein [Thermoleophilia bacterium]
MEDPIANLAIVAIGGGTGLPVLLRGLKRYPADITAIVSVADDGGSSGRLREELGIIAPGDIRNCLVALADDASPLAEAFQYRFEGGSLAGHSMGNIILAALAGNSGDFVAAIACAGEALGVRGRVIPASLDYLTLCAEKTDGGRVTGQAAIMSQPGSCRRAWLEPAGVRAPQEAIAAIGDADLIVIGPGSLFTSVIPNLLIEDIRDALAGSDCPRVFVCNVMTQPGETDGFDAADHILAVSEHAGSRVIDAAIINNHVPAASIALPQGEAEPVSAGAAAIEGQEITILHADVVREDDCSQHDSHKLAAAVMSLTDSRNCHSLPR